MCRYSPLSDWEINGQSMEDRNVVAGLYKFYRNAGDEQEDAAQKARAGAIRLVLGEMLG